MAAKKYRTAPDPNATGWPASVPYIIGNEGCERFSFYGMRAILYVYLVGLYINYLKMSPGTAESESTQTYHLFVGAVYAFPIIGAILADRVLGKYRTIFWLSLVYCAGHACLAIFESDALQIKMLGKAYVTPVQGMYLGLALIGIGSGGIKPCVSANVGDQFGPGNWHLLQKVFNAFYFIINFGSAFATLIIPWIRGTRLVTLDTSGQMEGGLASQGESWAYALPEVSMKVEYSGSVSWAFAIPGILMGLATLFFWAGRSKFVHVPPSHPGKLGWLDFVSGSFLFAVIAIPIWGHEFIHNWLSQEGTVEVSFWKEWGIIGIMCLASFVVFLVLFLGRQRLEQDDGFLAILVYCATRMIRGESDSDRNNQAKEDEKADDSNRWLIDHWFFKYSVRRFGLNATEGPAAVLKIMCIFSFVSLFWALFDQHSSTWIEQANQMDRTVDFSLFQFLLGGLVIGLAVGGAVFLTFYGSRRGTLFAYSAGGICVVGGIVFGLVGRYLVEKGYLVRLESSQIPAANPFMVMILIPYCNFGLYPLMDRLGFKPTPLRRMTIGMLMTGLSFVAVAVIQLFLQGSSGSGSESDPGIAATSVHVFWQLIPYLILTTSEVMVSITGLEFAYSQAPKRMKSVIMGFWLLTVTVGNVIVTLTAGFFEELDLLPFFSLFAIMMFAASFAFGIVTLFYKYKDYTQGA